MKKILTIIIDGFGIREESKGNAIKEADMSTFNRVWEEYPHSLLEASGEAVGLREGEFGNSETGHMTIGAGRKVLQNESLVDELLNNDISENETFKKLLEKKDRDIHLMGLCSDGCVHADVRQFIKFYKILVNNGFKKIHFHLITDGRDTGIHESYKYINMIEEEISKNNIGDISTVCGRYYAMDRDKKYERTKEYYDLITDGAGINYPNIKYVIDKMYEKDITDEFLKPILVNRNLIKNGDVLIWMNYREDRAKQIISAFVNPEFDGFRTKNMSDLEVYSFLEIDENINTNVFKEKENITNPLGLYLSELGITQARIAETEKYPHVTYFFDGGFLGKIKGCNTYQIPSPKVSTYDLQPEMSIVPVTKKVIDSLKEDVEFILVNFANPDMVGHTGNFDATVKACMAVDICLNKILEVAEDNFYKVIILADHGNADTMIDEEGNKVTTHTLSKVPFIIMDKSIELKENGDLTMVAPTILEYMDIAVPEEMKETEVLFK